MITNSPSRLLPLLALATFIAFGCASNPTVRSIPDNYAMGIREESVVIGRVVIDLSGGSIQPIGFFDRLDAIQVTVASLNTGETYSIVCDQSGSSSNFYVALPPGQYKITRVQKGQLESIPSGHFTAGKNEVVYVGTLKFTGRGIGAGITASLLAGGRTTLPGDWQVGDEYSIVVKSFQERFPRLNQEVVKSLIAQ